MAFTIYDRASLPNRDPNVRIGANSGLMIFNHDFLLANDMTEFKFISMYYDETLGKMAFKQCSDIADLSAFDFIYPSVFEASANIHEFLSAKSLISETSKVFDVAYDDVNLIFVLTERV